MSRIEQEELDNIGNRVYGSLNVSQKTMKWKEKVKQETFKFLPFGHRF